MKNDLLAFELVDPCFIGMHDRGVARFNDPVEKAFDLTRNVM
ncbi:hypothetical protein [Tabrizicola sp.]|nr:hypothetical protein [Tabrizicola sp.]MDP3197742.1 hypothetical protein [Tabrizicola sp.]MDZ4055890.1 hypothetical protein [Polynucleobacter sp.]